MISDYSVEGENDVSFAAQIHSSLLVVKPSSFKIGGNGRYVSVIEKPVSGRFASNQKLAQM